MNNSKKGLDQTMVIILVFTVIKLLIHLYTNAFAGYGLFRDEFYYLACSARPAWGYVDQPPLSLFILTLFRLVFGNSVFAIRLAPAILGALTVFFSGLIVRKMNGGVAAIVISCITIIFAPIILGMNGYYSMNSFDIFFWTLACYFLVLIWNEGKQIHWLSLGLVIGLGMMNKISMAWLVIGVVAAVLLTSKRKMLLTRWPYLGAGIAVLLFLPFVIWNFTHDFAHLEFMQNASQDKYNGITRMDFIVGQIMNMNPLALPIWLFGLFYLLLNRKGRAFNVIAIVYLATLLILLINGHSKAEYIAPAFIPLIAAGGVQREQWGRKKYLGWIKFAFPAVIIFTGVFLAPMALPILPVEKYIAYTQKLGITQKSPESKELSALPQYYADMFGWEDMAKTVADVYHSLSPEEQACTVIYGQNYGEAGAIEYYSKKYNLPRAISGHNNYWLWGWNEVSDDIKLVIIIGGRQEDHLRNLEQVEPVATFTNPYCMPYENNLTIYVCRNLKAPIKSIWGKNKHYD